MANSKAKKGNDKAKAEMKEQKVVEETKVERTEKKYKGFDRVGFKEDAKKMIKNNLWYIWKPMVIFDAILFGVAFIISLIFILCGAKDAELGVLSSSLGSIGSFLETFFLFGYAKYCIDFVRGQKDDWKVPFTFAKEHFVSILLVDLLFALNVSIGFILLIVPGIMAALGLAFLQEVYADDPDLEVTEALKRAWKITDGYKWDIFVFGLSFIGWFILGALTLGILLIWVVPYMTIASTIAYNHLKSAA